MILFNSPLQIIGKRILNELWETAVFIHEVLHRLFLEVLEVREVPLRDRLRFLDGRKFTRGALSVLVTRGVDHAQRSLFCQYGQQDLCIFRECEVFVKVGG